MNMDINVFSVVMAVIWSSAVVLFFYFGRKRRNFIRYFGITNLMILYVICMARLLIPVEFPFVKVIGIGGILAGIYEVTCLDQVRIFGMHTTVAYLFLAIWLLGVAVFMFRWMIQYRKAGRWVNILKNYRDFQAEQILKQIKNCYGHKPDVEVWRMSQIEIPMGIGVLHKTILLPEKTYTNEELHYILLHEYTHFVNRDIEIKMLSHIFCCIFWWNPVVYLLKKDLDQTIEIKCDLTVTRSMDKNEVASYLAVIVAMIKNAGKKREKKQVLLSTMLFQPQMDAAVVERFQVVTDEYTITKKKAVLYYGCIVLLCGLMAFSYLFQFQAVFPMPPLEEGEEMTPENTYILDNGDGTYVLIDVNGEIEDSIVDEKWIIEDMISQGFTVENERRK